MEAKTGSESLKVNGRQVVFMCYLGEERSVAMRRLVEDSGKKAGVFKGGTKRLVTMDDHQIRKELDDVFVYLITKAGAPTESHCATKAEEKMDDLGIPYKVLGTSDLYILAHSFKRNLDDYLV